MPWGSSWVRGAAAALAVVCAALAMPPAAVAAEEDEAAGIIIVGIPGLEWTDVDAAGTPHLWDLAGSGASAAMSVRTIGSWTCPESGWVSLGAGERAGGVAPREAQCTAQSRLLAPVEDSEGWAVEGWDAVVEANAEFNYGARLGSLADTVAEMAAEQEAAAAEAEANGETAVEPEPGSCVAGIGDGAAFAAADTQGRISFWAPGLDELGAAMAACDVVIVDPGVIIGDTADKAPDSSTDYDQLGQDDTDVGSEEPTEADADAGEIEPEAAAVRDAAGRGGGRRRGRGRSGAARGLAAAGRGDAGCLGAFGAASGPVFGCGCRGRRFDVGDDGPRRVRPVRRPLGDRFGGGRRGDSRDRGGRPGHRAAGRCAHRAPRPSRKASTRPGLPRPCPL